MKDRGEAMREGILRQAKSIVQKINEYSVSQKVFWQRIPYLALEADGRTGFDENLNRAYSEGRWVIEGSSQHGYYRIMVDLATGKLVNPFKPIDSAPKDVILGISSYLDQLDAKAIVERLETKSRKPCGSYYSEKEHEITDRRREQLRESLGLERIFTRG